MDLSIIIVSWNTKEKLKNNLAGLFKSKTDFSFEVFAVDNNSADGSAEMVRRDFPAVKLITNQENLGFAKANNQALKKAQGEFVLLLNPDMLVFPDTLENMVSWMKKTNQADVAGCLLVDEKGGAIKQVRKFPSLFDQLAIVLKLPHFFPKILNKYIISDFDYSREALVDSIRGSFFMIRKSSLAKILSPERLTRGEFLDERYFLWFEEVDFCRQVKEKGGEVWYAPVAKCLDFVGTSFSQLPRASTQKYFRASQLTYFKKWHPGWQCWILKISWMPVMILAKFILVFKKIKNKKL